MPVMVEQVCCSNWCSAVVNIEISTSLSVIEICIFNRQQRGWMMQVAWRRCAKRRPTSAFQKAVYLDMTKITTARVKSLSKSWETSTYTNEVAPNGQIPPKRRVLVWWVNSTARPVIRTRLSS